MFIERHLDSFRALSRPWGNQPLGVSPASWYAYIVSNADFNSSDSLSKMPLSRLELLTLSKSSAVSSFDCCVSIMAWGGMNRKHGTKALATFHIWESVIDQLRGGVICHLEAFEKFQAIRKAGDLPGMGIAYFTKLIYFLDVFNKGYILDQWTARSTNLLHGKNAISLTWGSYGKRRFAVVNDKNTAVEYDFFCNFVTELAALCDHLTSPDETEEALFSQGRKQGNWRDYVIQQT